MTKTPDEKNKPKKEPENDCIEELTVLETFLYEILASENPELNLKIMKAAVKKVLQDVTPDVIQQIKLDYANALACELEKQDGPVE